MKINYYQKIGGKKIKLICSQCGKEFERYSYDIEKRNAKYCSLECLYKSKIIKIPVTRDILYKRYWEDKISVNQLAREYKVSKGLIDKWFKNMSIPTRSISEAVVISGDNMTDGQKKKQIKKLLNSQKSGVNYGGKRADIGIYCRSRWEANLGRYYNYAGIKWLYEPKIFYFNDSLLMGKKKIKKGTLSYTPDFYLPELDTWVEVKGYLRDKDKTRLRRFKKYYPVQFAKLWFVIRDKYSRSVANGKIISFLVDELGIDFNTIRIESYKEMEKYKKLIPNWE